MKRTNIVALVLVAGLALVSRGLSVDPPLLLSATSIPVGNGLPTSILTPDLNGDGLADLVVTQYETYRITPILNHGDGTVTVLPSSDTGGRPLGSVAALVDDDEHPDVILVELESDNAWFLKGRGDGTFEEARGPIFIDHDPLVVSGGDFNEDGKFDIAIARSPEGPSYLTALLGNGDGTFDTFILNQRINDFGVAIAVADINEDGHADILGSYSQTSIALLLGNGDGTFAELQEIPTGSRSPVIRPIDLDHDGHLDLFLMQTNIDSVAVMRGRGDGTFDSPVRYPAGESPAYSTLVDVNRDGELDVVAQSIVSFDVRVLLNQGAGVFGSPRSFAGVGMSQLVTALDLDGDAVAEVVAASAIAGNAALSVFRTRADGSLAAPENLIGDTGAAMVTADTDNNALPDLIVAVPVSRRIDTFLSRPGVASPAAITAAELDIPVGRLAAADFDADGHVDLLGAAATIRAAVVMRGHGDGTFDVVTSLELPTGGGSTAVFATDLNADGRHDVLITQTDGGMTSFLGRGDGSFAAPLRSVSVSGTAVPGLGDFNRDGWPDLAVIDSRQSRISIYLGDGLGSFNVGPSIATTRQVSAVSISDFDLDGFDDVAFSDAMNSLVGIAINDGSGGFEAPKNVTTGRTQMSLATRDLSGDPRPDLIVSIQETATVQVFECADDFPRVGSAGTGNRPLATLSADFDGDGRYDIATLNDVPSTVATIVPSLAGNLHPRGDANRDSVASAADAVRIQQALHRGDGLRIESAAARAGATASLDANGDGILSRQDLVAQIVHVFAASVQ